MFSFVIHSFSNIFLMMMSFFGGLSMHMMEMLQALWLGKLKWRPTSLFLLCLASAQCSPTRHSMVRPVSPTYCISQVAQVMRYMTLSDWQVMCLRIAKVSPVEELVKVVLSVVWEIDTLPTSECALLWLQDLHEGPPQANEPRRRGVILGRVDRTRRSFKLALLR